MNHPAQNAKQRKPHGTAPKPRAIVAKPRQTPLAAALRSQRAEGNLIRLVGRLAADVSGNAANRAAHVHCITGYLMALEVEGIVPATRLATIRHTCMVLLDGTITLQDLKAMKTAGTDTDPGYLRAVGLVRRAGHADIATLASELAVGTTAARTMVEQMEAEGLINPPDMFGTRVVRTVEVRHG